MGGSWRFCLVAASKCCCLGLSYSLPYSRSHACSLRASRLLHGKYSGRAVLGSSSGRKAACHRNLRHGAFAGGLLEQQQQRKRCQRAGGVRRHHCRLFLAAFKPGQALDSLRCATTICPPLGIKGERAPVQQQTVVGHSWCGGSPHQHAVATPLKCAHLAALHRRTAASAAAAVLEFDCSCRHQACRGVRWTNPAVAMLGCDVCKGHVKAWERRR